MAYNYPKPDYGLQSPAFTTTVEKKVQDTTVPVSDVVEDAPRWSWYSTGWSIFSLFCCSCCCSCWCGMSAVLCSLWSYMDYKLGDYDQARRKRKWAWICACITILLGITIIGCFIISVLAKKDKVCESLYKQYSESGYYETICHAIGGNWGEAKAL